MLSELNNKLETERNHANNANEAKSEFISKMSHEMRNNLQIIEGYLSIMQETKEYNEEFLDRIKSSASNVLTLLDEFLDLKLIEIGKVTLNYTPINIKDNLREVFNFFILQFERNKLVNQLEIDSSIPDLLLVDHYRLNQILINLIQNSIKYTLKGFVKVKLSLLKETTDSCTLLYEIADSGIGIKDEDKSLLFKEFERTTSSQNIAIKGVGLGLAIVLNLVHAFNGDIWFESQFGVGTKFFVKLNFQKY